MSALTAQRKARCSADIQDIHSIDRPLVEEEEEDLKKRLRKTAAVGGGRIGLLGAGDQLFTQ